MNNIKEVIDRYNINIFERYSDLKRAEKSKVTHYDLAKIFEYYTCIKLSHEYNQPFYEYDDIDPSFKENHKMSRNDSGVDASNLLDTIVQCKLRKESLTWGELGTFFGSQNIFDDEMNKTVIRWEHLIIARNSTSKLSPNLKFRQQLFIDKPFSLKEMIQYCESLKEEDLNYPQLIAPDFKLRDYQNECIQLITENNQNVTINLPTGTGKNSIIIYSMKENTKYLIVVPRIILMEQLYEEIIKHKPKLRNTIQLIGDGNNKFNINKNITICVFNSINVVEKYCDKFEKIYIDEAHHICKPEIYEIEEDEIKEVEDIKLINENIEGENEEAEKNEEDIDEIIEEELKDGTEDEIVNVNAHTKIIKSLTKYNNNVYLSATIDKIVGFIHYSKDIRYMIDNKYLCDYIIKVPIFNKTASNKNICEYLINGYRNIIIYSHSQQEGKQLNNLMNEILPNSCAYIDCKTPKRLRNEIIAKYKKGILPFIVNVRILVEGFDAPITKGICFLHMPSSKTSIIQIIGRALRLHVNKTFANIILPFSVNDDEKSIMAFLKIMACNDSQIKKSYNTKTIGGYISLDVINIITDETKNDDAIFRWERIYNDMTILQNNEQIWINMFRKLKQFIDDNSCLPPKNYGNNIYIKLLYCWLSNQRRNYRLITKCMKNDNIYNLFHNFINDDKYKKYFLSTKTKETIWINNLEQTKIYIDQYGKLPLNTCVLGEWISLQKEYYKKTKGIFTDKMYRDLWKNFINENGKLFMTNENEWMINLDKLKNYIIKFREIPKPNTILYNWMQKQKSTFKIRTKIMQHEKIYEIWKTFISDEQFYIYFADYIDKWKNTFAIVLKYIDDYNKIPSQANENPEIVKLHSWFELQKKNYKTKSSYMSNPIIYTMWSDILQHEKYKYYFLDTKSQWIHKFNQIINYIENNHKLPVNECNFDDGIHMDKWIDYQNRNYKTKTNTMADDDLYTIWDNFRSDIRYKYLFMTNEEIWMGHYKQLLSYINTKHKIPSIKSTNINIKKLGTWHRSQKFNYNRISGTMKISNVYDKWTDLINSTEYINAKNNK